MKRLLKYSALAALIVTIAFFTMGGAPAPALGNPVVKVLVGPEGFLGHGSATYIGGGRFLTAAHVVSSGAQLYVSIGEEEKPVTVLWANTDYDLALIEVDGSPDLLASSLSCAEAPVGEPVRAIGFPLIMDRITARGYVGGEARQLDRLKRVFELDASVAPGMSGGPVYDRRGRMVGVVVAVFPGYAMSLAVPTSVACKLMGRDI